MRKVSSGGQRRRHTPCAAMSGTRRVPSTLDTRYTIAIADEQTCLRLNRPQLRRAVRTVLKEAGVSTARISLAFVDDPTIARLNEQFLSHEGPTDVLSFVLEQVDGCLEGEVIVGAETAAREASRFDLTPHEELLLYVIHGMLHLVGYDDKSVRQRTEMRRREAAVLAKIVGRRESGVGSRA